MKKVFFSTICTFFIAFASRKRLCGMLSEKYVEGTNQQDWKPGTMMVIFARNGPGFCVNRRRKNVLNRYIYMYKHFP